MGNKLCARSGKAQKQVQDVWQDPPFKVVRPDGTIEVFRRSVTALELINQHPDHSVFHSSCAMHPLLTPASALPPNKELEGGRLYYVLPANSFLHQKGHVPPPAARFKGSSRGLPVSKLTVVKLPQAGFPQMIVGQAVLHISGPRSQGTSWKPRLEMINEVGDSSGCHIHNLMRARSQRKSQRKIQMKIADERLAHF